MHHNPFKAAVFWLQRILRSIASATGIDICV